MPIVIDADAAASLASGSCRSSTRILNWVRGGGEVHSCPSLQRELGRTPLSTLLAAWSAAGRLKIFSAIEIEEAAAEAAQLAESNDHHILAVVNVGGAQVVVTGDRRLMSDLKNLMICRPKRKVISCTQGQFSRLNIVEGILAKYA